MSLEIIKSGLLDTIQDLGRYGYQHLGINPGGAMDRFAAQTANALLGKEFNSPVIEMHFPASAILFHRETIICITGADFSPTISHKKIPIFQPVIVNKKSVLHFEKNLSGACCYISFLHDLDLEKWLNSYSTNLTANAGGFKGRTLKKGDLINFKDSFKYKNLAREKDFAALSWSASEKLFFKKEIRFIKGNEWDWLTESAENIFLKNTFNITKNSNRMGYRLKGDALTVKESRQLISSGVTFGTIQLLPDGQLIILMADHQTTGGYPRVGHVISADLPILAQKNPGDEIKFIQVEIEEAQLEIIAQHKNLLQMQTASTFKIENLLNAM